VHEHLQDITHLIALGCLLLMLLTGIAYYSRRFRVTAEAWTLIMGKGHRLPVLRQSLGRIHIGKISE
jgi:hypothetical protein